MGVYMRSSTSVAYSVPRAPSSSCVLDLWLWCATGEARVGGEELHAVLPLGHGALWAWQARPWVMGILNVTPDSFSDGGAYLEVGFLIPLCTGLQR